MDHLAVGRALHSNRRTSQPRWRLDDIAVAVPPAQMSRDPGRRPPRQQVATIGRLQGSELKRADNRVMGASNAAHDDALPSPPRTASLLARRRAHGADSLAESGPMPSVPTSCSGGGRSEAAASAWRSAVSGGAAPRDRLSEGGSFGFLDFRPFPNWA